MLREKLENQIDVYISSKCIDPNVIIMHPKTWEQLCKEVRASNVTYFAGSVYVMNKNQIELRYRGKKVFRSFDILEGEFEVR